MRVLYEWEMCSPLTIHSFCFWMGGLTKWSLTWSLVWVMFVAEKTWEPTDPNQTNAKIQLLFNYKLKDNLKILRLFYFKQDLSYYYTHILILDRQPFSDRNDIQCDLTFFFFYSVCFCKNYLRLISLFSLDVNLYILSHFPVFFVLFICSW